MFFFFFLLWVGNGLNYSGFRPDLVLCVTGNAVLFQHSDLIFLFLVIIQHSVLGDLTLCLYYIQKYILFFFMHNFSLCKQKGNFEVSDPPYSLGGVRFIFNTSPESMDTYI